MRGIIATAVINQQDPYSFPNDSQAVVVRLINSGKFPARYKRE